MAQINERLAAGVSGGVITQATASFPGEGDPTTSTSVQGALGAGATFRATDLTDFFVSTGGVVQYAPSASPSDVPAPAIDDTSTTPPITTLQGLPESGDDNNVSLGWTAAAGVTHQFERFSAQFSVGMGHPNVGGASSSPQSKGSTAEPFRFNLFAPSQYGPYARFALSSKNPESIVKTGGVSVSETSHNLPGPDDESPARETVVSASGFGVAQPGEFTTVQAGVTVTVHDDIDPQASGQDENTLYKQQAHSLFTGAVRLTQGLGEPLKAFVGGSVNVSRPSGDEDKKDVALGLQAGLNLNLPGLRVTQSIIPSLYIGSTVGDPLTYGANLTYYLTPNQIFPAHETPSLIAQRATLYASGGVSSGGNGYALLIGLRAGF